MSIEPWQYKPYYKPRILIDYDDLITPPLPPMTLVCLTGAELGILRNLLAYCHRRSTFVVTYGTEYYIAPGAVEWDVVQAIVAELENKLMSGCEDLIEQMEAMVTALQAQVAQQTAMSTSLATIAGWDLGTTEGLACICKALQSMKQDPATQSQIDDYRSRGDLQTDDFYPWEDTPEIDTDACAIAQLTWHFMYETMTEIVAPAQDKAVSVLLPLALATIAAWCGAAILAIPTGVILVLLWDLIEVWVEGRFAAVQNAIWNNKDELICAAYAVLKETGTLGDASAAIAGAIDEIPDLSPLDKVTLKALSAPWVISRMGVAWENVTDWATQRVVANYCATCSIIEGDDWYAIAIEEPEGDLIFNHEPYGTSWITHTYCDDNLGEIVGYVGEVMEFTGNCVLTWDNDVAQECTGETISSTDVISQDTPMYNYIYRPFTHDDVQAHAQLCPLAIKHDSNLNNNFNYDRFAIQARMGWSCAGTALLRIHYIVYLKE